MKMSHDGFQILIVKHVSLDVLRFDEGVPWRQQVSVIDAAAFR